MLGTWVNVAAVLIGGSIGLLIQKGLSQRLADTLMKGLALCTITIGISGALGGSDTLKLILSVVIGGLGWSGAFPRKLAAFPSPRDSLLPA